MRKEIDLHGYKLEDAVQKVHSIIGQARINGGEEDWCFITGSGGPIQKAVINELEDYGLSTEVPAYNLGVVLATVE